MNENMRDVIIVSKVDLNYGNSAAVARMNNYAKALSLNKKNNVYLIPLNRIENDSEFIQIKSNIYSITKNKFRNIGKYNFLSNYFLFLRFKTLLKKAKKESPIIYYPNTDTIIFDFLLILFTKNNIYCEVNEVRKYSSSSQSNLLARMRIRLYNYFYEKTFRFYRGLIFISPNIKEYYKKRTPNHITIPILSDIIPFKKKEISNEKSTFVFTGSVSFEKENLHELIHGFKLYLTLGFDSELLLYGSISKLDRNKLKSLLQELSIQENVLYCGIIKQSLVISILQNADCLLLPRKNNKQNYYGFSTKLSEYAISGTPIILTDTGVVSDFFRDKENCLMCNGYDRFAFKEQFINFSNLSQEDKQRLAYNAYLTAQNSFSYKIHSAKLDNFIK